MRLGIVRKVAVMAAVAFVVAGCGHKRPPAVATSTPGTTAGGRAGSSGTQPIDEGTGVSPIGNEGVSASDMTDSGEGGPLADIHFSYDEATLGDEAKTTLDQNAQWLQAHAAAKVRIEGNCDERGTVEYNLALGDRRAQAARDYLVGRGVDASRLTVVSYGKERPIDTGRDEAAYARNRRDHFAVSQ